VIRTALLLARWSSERERYAMRLVGTKRLLKTQAQCAIMVAKSADGIPFVL